MVPFEHDYNGSGSSIGSALDREIGSLRPRKDSSELNTIDKRSKVDSSNISAQRIVTQSRQESTNLAVRTAPDQNVVNTVYNLRIDKSTSEEALSLHLKMDSSYMGYAED